MHAMVLMIAVLCVLAIGYAIYSRFLAFKVMALDDSRQTPAYALNDGQNYHPTNKWVLFGHHFAAISGAGPLIGPVLAAQFGYLPGLLWILIGVVLGGAVQDFVILVLSTRRQGKSLAHIARDEIGRVPGMAAMIGILFVLVIALAGLGKVVVKALGGEEVTYPVGTVIQAPQNAFILDTGKFDRTLVYSIPQGATIIYPNGAQVPVGQKFELTARATTGYAPIDIAVRNEKGIAGGALEIKPDVLATRAIKGSAWGTFTIALTIPIALFVGIYMYRIRKGRILEASIIGGLLTLGAVYLGGFIDQPDSFLHPLADTFNLSEFQIATAMAIYGFVAAILPVWMLLCPRDYLSSFLKIGTIALLVVGVIIANPVIQAPALNETFMDGGPIIKGNIFPFVFIVIMCGAISGFHALVSSGTTPKMIKRESDARAIGYGAMLIEGLVGIVALIAAASLPNAHYYHMNTAWNDLPNYQQKIVQLSQNDKVEHTLPQIEAQVGETLQGRTGGAVTLAVGMAEIFDTAAKRLLGSASAGVAWLEGMIKYWYHFAIMFEALFILTTIDTGTRVGRFVLQELMGKVKPHWGKPDYLPTAIIATALLVAGWWYFINANSMAAIWPMFGIANQMLAVMALAIASVAIIRSGKARYAWVTLLPMTFVTITTTTTAVIMLADRVQRIAAPNATTRQIVDACITGGLIVGIVACTATILVGGALRIARKDPAPQTKPAETVGTP